MKTSHSIIAASAIASGLLLSGCGALLDTSLDVSPAPGVGVSVGVGTPVTGWWDDGSYYPPYWGGSVFGPPAWGIGAPAWNPSPRPPRPAWHPNERPQGNWRPGNTRPVVPPAGTLRPYPTGPGPVTGGTGLPVIHPGTPINPVGNGMRPGGGFRPAR